MIAKKSIETGESCDSIPESMRQYLAQQLDLKGGKDPSNRGRGGGQTPSSTESSQSSKVGKSKGISLDHSPHDADGIHSHPPLHLSFS